MTRNKTNKQQSKQLFKLHEMKQAGFHITLDALFAAIPWNQDGLIPVIAQDATSKQVLMLAWANQDAIQRSIDTKKAHYWSRSRQNIWCKGETSGHHQTVLNIQLDCDGDALLYLVNQTGAACHTHREHCFFWSLEASGAEITLNPGK